MKLQKRSFLGHSNEKKETKIVWIRMRDDHTKWNQYCLLIRLILAFFQTDEYIEFWYSTRERRKKKDELHLCTDRDSVLELYFIFIFISIFISLSSRFILLVSIFSQFLFFASIYQFHCCFFFCCVCLSRSDWCWFFAETIQSAQIDLYGQWHRLFSALWSHEIGRFEPKTEISTTKATKTCNFSMNLDLIVHLYFISSKIRAKAKREKKETYTDTSIDWFVI